MAKQIINTETQRSLQNDMNDRTMIDQPIQKYAYQASGEIEGKQAIHYEAKRVKASHTYAGCTTIVLSDKTPMVELAEKKESESYVKKLVASITHDLRTPLNRILSTRRNLA